MSEAPDKKMRDLAVKALVSTALRFAEEANKDPNGEHTEQAIARLFTASRLLAVMELRDLAANADKDDPRAEYALLYAADQIQRLAVHHMEKGNLSDKAGDLSNTVIG